MCACGTCSGMYSVPVPHVGHRKNSRSWTSTTARPLYFTSSPGAPSSSNFFPLLSCRVEPWWHYFPPNDPYQRFTPPVRTRGTRECLPKALHLQTLKSSEQMKNCDLRYKCSRFGPQPRGHQHIPGHSSPDPFPPECRASVLSAA